MPDEELMEARPDVTAVFEESYARYRSRNAHEQELMEHYDRSGACIFVHSVPEEKLIKTVSELRHRAQYLFVTDLRRDYYNKFGPRWAEFVDAMAA